MCYCASTEMVIEFVVLSCCGTLRGKVMGMLVLMRMMSIMGGMVGVERSC